MTVDQRLVKLALYYLRMVLLQVIGLFVVDSSGIVESGELNLLVGEILRFQMRSASSPLRFTLDLNLTETIPAYDA